MKEYERQLFDGICPYTGKPCGTEIDCRDCETEVEERNLYDEEKEDLCGKK